MPSANNSRTPTAAIKPEETESVQCCITCKRASDQYINSQCALCAWVNPTQANVEKVMCIVDDCENRAQFTFRGQEYCFEHMPCIQCHPWAYEDCRNADPETVKYLCTKCKKQ
jgi:hypothetical protein